MKKSFFLIGFLLLTSCGQAWQPMPYGAPHQIVRQDGEFAVIEYQNSYGIEFNDSSSDMPELMTLDDDGFFGPSEWPNEDCADGTVAEKIPLVSWHVKCPEDVDGCGGSDRFALICGDFYVVREFALAFGPLYFGPFSLGDDELGGSIEP